MVWTCTTYCDFTIVTCPCRPTERRNEGSGSIRRPAVRFQRWCNISEVRLLRLRPTGRHQSMTWYHADPVLKRYKGEQVTSESDLMSLSCRVIAVSSLLCLCLYYYFLTPLHSPAWVYTSSSISFSISVSLPVCLHWVDGLTLSWLGKIDRRSDGRKGRDIKMKARET